MIFFPTGFYSTQNDKKNWFKHYFVEVQVNLYYSSVSLQNETCSIVTN